MSGRSDGGRLRVIGGSMRGRRIGTLPGASIRPTGDRVREALFDILGGLIRDAAFLDIYAGTGAVGIEALSRGARLVVFIERDRAAVDLIRRNLEIVRADPARTRIIARDPVQAVPLLVREAQRFDIVFMDPPYESGDLERGLLEVGSGGLLTPAAIVVAEHDANDAPPRTPMLSASRTARYGRTALTFYAPIPSHGVDTIREGG